MVMKEVIYTKVLLWAYKKEWAGFTKKQLREELGIKDNGVMIWIESIFFVGTNNDRPLFGQIPHDGDESYYALTDKGVAAAVDFLELHEARASSKWAMRIAIVAIFISAIIGLYQIFFPQDVRIIEGYCTVQGVAIVPNPTHANQMNTSIIVGVHSFRKTPIPTPTTTQNTNIPC